MQRDIILKNLLAKKSGFLSGAELAGRLKISRTAVWKHIKALERDGFTIQAVPSQGYRITAMPDTLLKKDIEHGRTTTMIGKKIHLLPEVASTNTLAMDLAQQGSPEGTVVIAEKQTGGKGRLGRTWISPKRNLYLSIILRPRISPYKAPLITLMGAVAVTAALRRQVNVQAEIKWPNDVLIAGKKVCGLLTEMSADPDRINHIVLGIGINVNVEREKLPREIRHTATTLYAETGRTMNRVKLLNRLFLEVERWYGVFLKDDAALLKEWERLNSTIGNRVTVGGPGWTLEGMARGVDAEGRLLVEQDDGAVQMVTAGDVTILKKP